MFILVIDKGWKLVSEIIFKVFKYKVLISNIYNFWLLLVSINIVVNISKIFVMVRVCNVGGVCIVVWDINYYFIVYYFVYDNVS